jgi:hypothetical protein
VPLFHGGNTGSNPVARAISALIRWTNLVPVLHSFISRVPATGSEFVADSPLEEAVSSEPVSEVGVFGAWELRVIPRPLWTIIEAEKGYFGLENGGVSVFAPWQLPPLSGS